MGLLGDLDRFGNLLNAYLPGGYEDITPQELHAEFIRLWDGFGVTIAHAKNGS